MSTYAYGPSAPLPARRSGMRTAGRWMFLVGLVLSLLTVGVMVWGGTQVFRAATALDEAGTTQVEGATTLTMGERSLRLIVSSASEVPTCTVTDPSGAAVPTTADPNLDVITADQQYRVVGSITARSAGDYTVECTGPAEVTGELPASAIAGATAGLLGFLALLPLGLLTVVGLIMWLVGRSRDRKAATAPGVGWGYGPGQRAQQYGQPNTPPLAHYGQPNTPPSEQYGQQPPPPGQYAQQPPSGQYGQQPPPPPNPYAQPDDGPDDPRR